MTKETIKTFQYRITQATASQLVVIVQSMRIIIYIWHRRL